MINFLQAKNLLLINKNYWHILSVVFMGGFILTTLFLGQYFWLYLIALSVCLVATLMSPKAGFYTIFLCTMWFERFFTLQELQWGETSFKIYPLDFIIIFTVIAIAIRAVVRREWVQFKKIDLFVIAFGAICTLGFLLSFVHHGHIPFAFSTYKNYFLYAIIYFITYWLLRRRRDWQELMMWLSVGALGVFFFLFYGILVGQGLWSEYTPLSTYGSRLIAGTHVFYLIILGFWFLAGLIWKKPTFRSWGQKGNITILLLVGVAIVVSLVRHLWLALAFLLLVWLLFLIKDKRDYLFSLIKKTAVILVSGILAVLWIYVLIYGQIPNQVQKVGYALSSRLSIVNVINMEDESFRWRLNAWSSGINLWSTSPLLGVGFGQLLVGADETYVYEVPIRDLHNNYLGILIQLGLLGAVFVLVWFFYLVVRIYATWTKIKEQEDFGVRFLFTWSSVIIMFMVVFSVSVYWDINLFIIWWWLGLAALRFSFYENSPNK